MSCCYWFVLFALAISWPAARAGEGKTALKLSAEEETVVALVNAKRKEEKLPPLRISKLLTEVARKHSANMAKQGKLEHKLDGKGTGERLDEAEYLNLGWGENIYFGRKI